MSVFVPTSAPGAPVYARFELHPSFRLTEEYYDNFDRAGSGKKGNFRSTASPGLTLFANDPILSGSVTGDLSESYDSSTEGFAMFYSLSGALNAVITPRLALHVVDTLVKTDQAEAADRLALRTGRQTFTSNILALSADYRIADFDTRAYYRFSTFSDQNGADTKSQAIGGSVSKSILETNTVSLGYEYLDSRTSGTTTVETPTPAVPVTANALGGVPTAGTRGHQFSGSLSHLFSANLTGGVTGSYAIRTPQRSGGVTADSFNIWTVSLFSGYSVGRLTTSGNIGISTLSSPTAGDLHSVTTFSSIGYALPVGTASLSLDRGFSETFTTGQDFGVVETQGITGGYSYPFGLGATASASAFYRENKSTGLTAGPIATQAYGAAVLVSIPLLRWLTLDAEYRYLNQKQGDTLGSISSNYFRTSLSASF